MAAIAGSSLDSVPPVVRRCSQATHIGRSTPQRVLSKSSRLPGLRCRGAVVPRCSGLPHFGHNRAVAWCVTTAMADYQDLYIERFHLAIHSSTRSRTMASGTAPARDDSRAQRPAVEIDVSVTHHGPIIIGDPAQGMLSPCAMRWPSPMPASMLYSRCCAPLVRRIRGGAAPWVDPCNNILFADVHGQIGYRTRGQVPIRSRANAWLPVPAGQANSKG